MGVKCAVCTQSMEFYRRLVTSRDQSGSKTAIIAVGRDSRTDLTDHLLHHGVKVDYTAHVEPDSGFRPRLTPTLLLIDRARRVLNVWNGKLSAESEERVLSSVR